MSERVFLAIAGASGAISVAADAVGRHMLAGDPYRFELATTGARYGLIHAAALVGVALLAGRALGGFWLVAAGWLIVVGLAFFCGSLDLVALGAPQGLTALAPWGGTSFILAWLALLIAALRPRPAA
jgi:uncharacterized membrane protein YgdD (TMEM256/DUF423 family)